MHGGTRWSHGQQYLVEYVLFSSPQPLVTVGAIVRKMKDAYGMSLRVSNASNLLSKSMREGRVVRFSRGCYYHASRAEEAAEQLGFLYT